MSRDLELARKWRRNPVIMCEKGIVDGTILTPSLPLTYLGFLPKLTSVGIISTIKDRVDTQSA